MKKPTMISALAICAMLHMAGCASENPPTPDTSATTTASAVLAVADSSKRAAEPADSTSSISDTTGIRKTTERVRAFSTMQNQESGNVGIPTKTSAATKAPAKNTQPNKLVETTAPKTSDMVTKQKTTTKAPPKPASGYDKVATAADAKAVADRVIYYINQYRTAQGSKTAQKLPGLTQYSECRSKQLVTNFAHDTDDERAAATACKYGEYCSSEQLKAWGFTDTTPFYDSHSREAIAYDVSWGNETIDDLAENIAQHYKGSTGHWSYVGSSEYSYMAVGITKEGNRWYSCISMSETNQYG